MKDLVKKIVTGSISAVEKMYYKRLYKKKIHRKLLKPSDNIDGNYRKEIISYWKNAGYGIDTSWHKWYTSRSGIRDVRYIPEDIYYCRIEPALNREEFHAALGDKNIHDLILPDIKRPVTIIKNINGMFFTGDYTPVSSEKAVSECLEHREIVIKPTVKEGGGRGVCFMEPEKMPVK